MYPKKYFIGNWKMNGLKRDIYHLKNIEKFIKNKKYSKQILIFCLPFTLIDFFRQNIKTKSIQIGSQDVSDCTESFGAHTGSISAKMIKDLKCDFTIIGHSEKRASGDTDLKVSKKIEVATNNSLNVILCVGESLNEYKNKKSFSIVKNQLKKALDKNKSKLNKIIIAYEPIWSIGTGLVPSVEYLNSFYDKLSMYLKKDYKKNIPLLYGGSVSSKNIKNFVNIKKCSGFLIGGASLKSKDYIDIIKNYYS